MDSAQQNVARGVLDPRLTGLILQNVADGVFTVDPQFRITFFNRAAEEITGFDKADAVGKPCFEVFRTPICAQDCPLRQSLRTGRTVKNFEIDILTRKGQRQTISVSTAPLLDESGRFIGGVETFRDLSPLKDLQREVSGMYAFQNIVSKSAELRRLFEILPNVARSGAAVLLQGKNGTGRSLFAAAIHTLSPRADRPLIKVNCSAVPEQLLDSELFGSAEVPGKVLAAAGSTLFLKEVGALPLPVQGKLLRFLEHGEFETAPGGNGNGNTRGGAGAAATKRTVRADVRVVAATSHELDRLVSEGRFRRDLHYRLKVIVLRIPSLAQRSEDIPLLAEHFIQKFNHRLGRRIQGFEEEVVPLIARYPFPGNVRELENVLEHAYVVAKGPKITVADLPPYLTGGAWDESNDTATSGPEGPDGERQRIVEALRRYRWSIPQAAAELGMHRTTLWRKVKRLGLTHKP